MQVAIERKKLMRRKNLSMSLAGFMFIVAAGILSAAQAADTPTGATKQSGTIKPTTMRIRITLNNNVISADLVSNTAAKEFAAMLPLTLELTDYNNTEKVAQLSKKLTTTDAPAGFTPVAGDIAFYAPWGNLAIYYKGFGYSKELIKLGHIQGDLSILKSTTAQNALIELE